MRYFITGATGFIGSNLARRLAGQGHQVRALIRKRSRAGLLENKNIDLIEGTLMDTQILLKAMEGVDGVFHLAAYAKPWAKDPTHYNRINLQGTLNILEAAQQQGVTKVVFTSTAGTLGPSLNGPVNETTPRLHDFFNEYESTKFMAEKAVKDYVLKGMNISIVHPSRVYGPGVLSKSNSVTIMVKNFLKGLWRIIPGDGNKMGNYVYIDDVVDGHIAALEKGKPGEQYILGGENASYADFFHTIQSLSGKNYRLFKIPVSLLVAFTTLQMTLAGLIKRPPLIPPKWVRKYMYNWELDSTKAENELDYHITPLKTGLLHTIHWLENQSSHE